MRPDDAGADGRRAAHGHQRHIAKAHSLLAQGSAADNSHSPDQPAAERHAQVLAARALEDKLRARVEAWVAEARRAWDLGDADTAARGYEKTLSVAPEIAGVRLEFVTVPLLLN